MSPYLALPLAFFLVLLNGFFVAAEFALVKVRSTRVAELANEGSAAARMTLQAIRHLDAYLSATQLGITLASLALGAIAEPAFERLLHPLLHPLHLPDGVQKTVLVLIPLTIVTVFHVVIGELAPKSLAIQRSEAVSLAISFPLHFFYVLFRPGIWALNGLAAILLRLLKIPPASEHEVAHTEEELRMILQASGQSGVLKDSEVSLVKHVFEFADRTAGEIMVPRVDMVYLDASLSPAEALRKTEAYTYTRFPLCEGDADRVLGMIHVKDLTRLAAAGGELRQICREVVFVPESKSIDQLLREFQSRKLHMAIVVDEFGGTAGLVTLEDVLEQIVGEIHDEFEEAVTEVQPLDEHRLLVDGRALLADLRAEHGVEFAENGAETMGGWVLDQLGGIPQRGAVLRSGGYRVEVRDVRGRRVRKVLVTRPPVEGRT